MWFGSIGKYLLIMYCYEWNIGLWWGVMKGVVIYGVVICLWIYWYIFRDLKFNIVNCYWLILKIGIGLNFFIYFSEI